MPGPQLLRDLLVLTPDWVPLPSTRLCGNLATRAGLHCLSITSPPSKTHHKMLLVAQGTPGSMAKYFRLPWFSSIVFINIHPRCQRPLRLEGCRLPGRKAHGNGAICIPSLKLAIRARLPPPLKAGLPGVIENQWADAISGSLLQPWRGSHGGPQTDINNLASHCFDQP